jgi:hypothetical protein
MGKLHTAHHHIQKQRKIQKEGERQILLTSCLVLTLPAFTTVMNQVVCKAGM